ncbi:hypothetical protein FS749_004460 [Ceratobasidium sp. UAMH 11750]|nr:hypothetical protein FS749_004460 [Ceratobasidium sp. UAMH 11750]
MLPLLLLMLSPLMLMLLPLLVGPAIHRTDSHPFQASTSTNAPYTPCHTSAATGAKQVIDLTGSSPVYAPRAQEFPFGTPVKQEPIKLKDKDNLLAAPNFAQHGANNNVPLFAQPAFDFAPPFTY